MAGADDGLGEIAASPAKFTDKATHKATHKGWIASAAAVVLLIGLGAGLYLGRRTSPPLISSTLPATRRLTANPGSDPVISAAISPDGKYLAFSDRTGAYLRQVDTGETHPLSLPEGFNARPVSWYPDGSHILVAAVSGSEMKSGLWQISTVGGSPRKLSDEGRDAEVSPDGSQIVFLRGAEKSQELWLMGSDGQQPRKIAGDLGDLFRPRFGRVTASKSRFCEASTARDSMEYSRRLKFSTWQAINEKW